jgi:hypothetical protein
MNPTLSYLLGRRMWAVPSVNVWGSLSNFNAELLLTESMAGSKRILFGWFPVGGEVQRIQFGDLTDNKGNLLPEELSNPKVVVLPRGEIGVVVSGTETSKSFTLARAVATDQVAVCDLLIMEMG